MLFNRFFSKNTPLMVAAVATLTLMSCSSGPKKQTQEQTKTPVVIEQPQEVIEDAAYFIELSKQSLDTNPEQASQFLVNAANLYLAQEEHSNALWLAKNLLAKPELLTDEQQYQLLLIKGQSLTVLDEDADIQALLTQANELVTSAQLPDDIKFYQLQALVAEKQNQTILQLDAQLRVFALNGQSSNDDIVSLWEKFSQLTQWQQQQLELKKAPMVTQWLSFTQIANQYGHNDDALTRKLDTWQRQHSTHPANLIAEQFKEQIALTRINNQLQQSQSKQVIAVILPLSGKQAMAGQVAQQGLLAAYQNQNESVLHFIDANTLEFETLEEQLTTLEASAVIGPLLKSHVEQFLAQNITLPSLLLNLPSANQLNENQIAISMRPEDEAIQAASQLANQNYQKPLILSHNDSVSQRIAQAFATHWFKNTAQPIESMTYSQGKEMQTQLKKSLSVEGSELRNKDLRIRLDQVIKTESRNRRDIDMIYIVGNNAQTRLIKPYIDVNTSTFASIIPVYASSRSHSLTHDDSALVDLNGMTFTEMPWLINSEQQNTPLSKEAKALWPNRSDSLQRIFAMGYDALSLIEKFNAFKAKPYVRHYGQTGVLKLNDENILTRSLLWGQYTRRDVKQLAFAQ